MTKTLITSSHKIFEKWEKDIEENETETELLSNCCGAESTFGIDEYNTGYCAKCGMGAVFTTE